MSARKKRTAQSADKAELKRLREGLRRETDACRAKAGAFATARDALAAAPIGEFGDAVAFLQGQIRALYGVAANLDDLRCDDEVSF